MTNLFNNFFITCDASKPWGTHFQDSASPQMEALVELHDNIMFYLVIILFGVAWIIISIIRNYANDKSPISNKYLSKFISCVWSLTIQLLLLMLGLENILLLNVISIALGLAVWNLNRILAFNNGASNLISFNSICLEIIYFVGTRSLISLLINVITIPVVFAIIYLFPELIPHILYTIPLSLYGLEGPYGATWLEVYLTYGRPMTYPRADGRVATRFNRLDPDVEEALDRSIGGRFPSEIYSRILAHIVENN